MRKRPGREKRRRPGREEEELGEGRRDAGDGVVRRAAGDGGGVRPGEEDEVAAADGAR